MRVIVQALRTPLVASSFFFFWGGAVILSWVVCPLLPLFVRDRVRRRRLSQRMCRRAFQLFHGYMRALGLVRTEVAGPYPERPVGPFVMVANHPTLVDVTALLSSYDAVTCVVKASLIRNPFVGRLLRACGHIDGGRGDLASVTTILQEARARLEDGDGVLIFPEGTRSPPRSLHPFHRTAFELAVRTGAPVWPVFIGCDPPALARGVPIWRHPERAALQALTPQALVPAGEPRARASRALCRAVEASCRRWLEERALVDVAVSPVEPHRVNVDEPRPSSYKLSSPTEGRLGGASG
jgi:1-acyl-sn-glycerol-3-phosphate acyltransferase